MDDADRAIGLIEFDLVPRALQLRHAVETADVEAAHRLSGAGVFDLDLQLTPATAGRHEAGGLCLGDLVAITDLDARFNAGYRRGWLSVGLVVHGGSPQPGHGPGVTVIATGPASAFAVRADAAGHRGLSEAAVLEAVSAAPPDKLGSPQGELPRVPRRELP